MRFWGSLATSYISPNLDCVWNHPAFGVVNLSSQVEFGASQCTRSTVGTMDHLRGSFLDQKQQVSSDKKTLRIISYFYGLLHDRILILTYGKNKLNKFIPNGKPSLFIGFFRKTTFKQTIVWSLNWILLYVSYITLALPVVVLLKRWTTTLNAGSLRRYIVYICILICSLVSPSLINERTRSTISGGSVRSPRPWQSPSNPPKHWLLNVIKSPGQRVETLHRLQLENYQKTDAFLILILPFFCWMRWDFVEFLFMELGLLCFEFHAEVDRLWTSIIF